MFVDARHRDNIKHGGSAIVYDHRDDELEGHSQRERERERDTHTDFPFVRRVPCNCQSELIYRYKRL